MRIGGRGPLGMGLAGALGLILALQAPAAFADAVAAKARADGAVQGSSKDSATRSYRLSWGVRAIGADRLHQTGITGRGVTVAVIDSGLGADAAGLAKSLSNASVDIIPARKSAAQGDRHAVYIAETLVGSPGGEGSVGVAYDAQVLSIRADSDGACKKECAFSSLNLAKAVDYALSKKAKIIDLSLAGDHRLGEKFERALSHAVKAGAVVIVAAGNEGQADPEWPARYAADPRFAGSIVAVGAVNKQGEMAAFSDRAGATHASYVVAPGQKVVTDCDPDTCAIVSGTSFAAPHVAGALALLLQAFPDMNGRQALDLLLRSATTASGADGDTVYGRGRIDAYKAYQLGLAESIRAAPTPVPVPDLPPG
jgi:subtilisin family serine protease